MDLAQPACVVVSLRCVSSPLGLLFESDRSWPSVQREVSAWKDARKHAGFRSLFKDKSKRREGSRNLSPEKASTGQLKLELKPETRNCVGQDLHNLEQVIQDLNDRQRRVSPQFRGTTVEWASRCFSDRWSGHAKGASEGGHWSGQPQFTSDETQRNNIKVAEHRLTQIEIPREKWRPLLMDEDFVVLCQALFQAIGEEELT